MLYATLRESPCLLAAPNWYAAAAAAAIARPPPTIAPVRCM